MRSFDVVLVDNSIAHCGINLRVTKDFLNLLNRHSFVDGACGHRSTEFVRVYSIDVDTSAKLSQADLHAADLQAAMRRVQSYEQRRIIVVSLR